MSNLAASQLINELRRDLRESLFSGARKVMGTSKVTALLYGRKSEGVCFTTIIVDEGYKVRSPVM